MPSQVEHLASFSELLPLLERFAGPDRVTWYRGHAHADWRLEPSLARRTDGFALEMTLLKRFRQNAYRFLDFAPQSEWDWLFLMQHHGVPTRLLDWTESPLLALWFAVSDENHDAEDGIVWLLWPTVLNEAAKVATRHPQDILAFGDDSLIHYLPSKIEDNLIGKTVAVLAPRQFERVYAQQGVFTMCHRDPTPLEALPIDGHVRGLRIPADAKPRIRSALAHMGITKLTVFPELSNVAELCVKGLW